MNKTKHGKKMVAGIVVLLFFVLSLGQAGTINLPHKYPRTSPNLFSNSNFNGTTGWALTPIPQYDANVSRTADGSGSIRIPVNSSNYAQIQSAYFTNFKLNTLYTISFYVKTQHEPVYVSATLHLYDANNVRTFATGGTGQSAVSTTGEWQEIVCVINVSDPAIVKIKVVIEKREGPAYTADYYIDDVYFGEGISFDQPPVTSRQTFSGAKVKIDELGNWQVYESGAWKDFFPFALYPDLGRADYQSLSDQGFNLVMSQQFKSQVQKAKDATSTLNPNGMRAGLRLQKYATPGDSYWTHTLLATIISDINSTLSETLVCYDWDNENNWTTWSYWFDMVSTIRTNDTDHPIYVLNGSPGVQRLFSKRLSDISGTYTGFDMVNYESGFGKMQVLQYLEKQDTPVSIAQINYAEEESYGFRLRLYYALIMGAKGICWWGDGYDNNGNPDSTMMAEDRAWWSSITTLRGEINALLPIIKQPHWTTWAVTSTDSKIYFNTRDYNGDGYMIVLNAEDSPSLVTFTITGLDTTEIWDYFDDFFVTSVTADQFTVLLPANSTAVYRLVDVNYPETLFNGDMETAGSPLGTWITSGSGTTTRDTAIKFSGTASGKIVNSATTDDTMLLQFYSALKPNTTYRFTAMVKTDNVIKDSGAGTSSGAIVQLYAGGSNMFFPTGGIIGTSDWQLVEKIFTTSSAPNATWYVRLRLWSASGTVWFDNVSMQELHDNILLNGTMESAGSPIADWSDSGDGAITAATPTGYKGGLTCKMVNSNATDITTLQQSYPALKPNTTYNFSVWMKTENVVKDTPGPGVSGAIVQLYAGGSNMFFPTDGLVGTNDWTLVEHEFTTSATPNTTWYVRLRLWSASGTVWFDNACLYEVEQ
ncbi:MAG: carbohydrate binding domain-containing protein [Victivallaceae bacterium]|nr:carbohydrate binding domain-containing protein [Victivallaceae bacterium]